jgi:hypothetical protein
MVNEELKKDIVYKAYKVLRAAVDARYAGEWQLNFSFFKKPINYSSKWF